MAESSDPRALLDELSRRDFSVFLRRVWPLINGGAPLIWNWHIDALCHQLDRVFRGECTRLIINIPPRYGKSKIISSIWPAWVLGNRPKSSVVGISYSNELSGKLARDCLNVMQTPLYRQLFPRAAISRKRSATYDFDLVAGGGRLATSVTGTLTGRGGDLLVMDDVIKPDEAQSETVREAVNEWFRSTLSSRLNDKSTGAIILVMQRLHQNDLAGMLRETGEFECLSLPAIASEDREFALMRGRSHCFKAGEVLHPQREPREVLDQLRAQMGSVAFAAQYLQNPVPASGNMVHAEWLERFDPDTLDRTHGMVIQSWDTATKDNPHNDWSVCVTALLKQKKVYILDVYRRRLTFPKLKAQCIRLARDWSAESLLIEEQSSGSQLIQTLRAEHHRNVAEPIARKVEQDKVARLASVSAMIEAGKLLLPDDAPWLAEFTAELLGFPNAKFDDQVDALSQLMIWVRDRDRWDRDNRVYAPIYGQGFGRRRSQDQNPFS